MDWFKIAMFGLSATIFYNLVHAGMYITLCLLLIYIIVLVQHVTEESFS